MVDDFPPPEIIEVIQMETRRGEWRARLEEKRRCLSNIVILFKLILIIMLLTTSGIVYSHHNSIEGNAPWYVNSWLTRVARKIDRLEERSLALENILKKFKETTVDDVNRIKMMLHMDE